jgi:hypothetical protein
VPKSFTATAAFAPGLGSLIADVPAVVCLRLAKIARGGPSGKEEAKLMVTEKVAGAIHLQWALLNGNFGSNPRTMADGIVDHLARKVRANRRRLGG